MNYFRKGKRKRSSSFDIESMKVGSMDNAGHKIVNIFAKYDNYIIYEINSNSYQSRIRTIIHSENKELEKVYQARFNRVKDAFVEAKEMLNHTDYYDENKHMIAHTLSTYLFSDIDENKKGEKFYCLIENIKKKNRNYLINKLLLLLPSLISFVLLLFFHYYILIQYVIAILIGNIISISFFYDSGKLQEFNHYIYYIVAGTVKAILSIILGFFVFVVISSEIVRFSFFDNEWGRLLLFIAVGFSERFVLKMIAKTEKALLDN
ncbi:hypothetical protein F544_9410 [Bibersteinia trehalosi USDA-ARS-USMARC-190]|uniref:Uncharacterized protein n=1 Tax=Bibersteinia trehalosi USDA-ARS-USMARC-190 TaxID=1263832 RepID=W0R7A1_BIBTR|nr:hypothetical protein [Bibersteinia trehalosi]AHG86170.1 hypothetical protein F544_9410 [Bibersteinia trehalosi USDA-ARS-USMARC-190]